MQNELMKNVLPELMSRNPREKLKGRPDTFQGLKRSHKRGIAVGSFPAPLSVESSPITPSGLLIIAENNRKGGSVIGNFDSRKNSYDDKYTSQRALQALKEYIAHRNQTQRRMNRPLGGEVGFLCDSIYDAACRVTELMGPATRDNRKYNYARLGEKFKDMREKGLGTPCNGFTSRSVIVDHRGSGLMVREWRIDYDPKKGYHFNVKIRPPVLGGNGYEPRISPDNDLNVLNLALIFDIPVGLTRGFEHLVDIVNSHLVADMDGDPVDNASYLGTILSR